MHHLDLTNYWTCSFRDKWTNWWICSINNHQLWIQVQIPSHIPHRYYLRRNCYSKIIMAVFNQVIIKHFSQVNRHLYFVKNSCFSCNLYYIVMFWNKKSNNVLPFGKNNRFEAFCRIDYKKCSGATVAIEVM